MNLITGLRVSGRRWQTGLTRVEWIASLLVGAVLSTVLLIKLTHYQEFARTAVMEMTVTNMRSGLRMRVAELVMANRNAELAGLLQQNPIEWLDAPPPNYVGMLQQPDRDALKPDSWYFDPTQHELVYLIPRNSMQFGAAPGAKSLQVRVVAVKPGSSNLSKVTEGVALEIRYER